MKYANSLDNKIEIAGEEYTVELYVSDNGSLEENAVSAASAIVSSGALISLGSYDDARQHEQIAVGKVASGCSASRTSWRCSSPRWWRWC